MNPNNFSIGSQVQIDGSVGQLLNLNIPAGIAAEMIGRTFEIKQIKTLGGGYAVLSSGDASLTGWNVNLSLLKSIGPKEDSIRL